MSRNNNGLYTLPAGNPVVSGEVISTAWGNPTMEDIAAALTDSLSRSGQGGMLAPFKNADGTQANPGITWSNEATSGFYRATLNDMRASVNGVNRMRWTAAGTDIWTGAVWSPVASAVTLAAYTQRAVDEPITGYWNFKNGMQVDGYLEMAVPVGFATDYSLISFWDYNNPLNEKSWILQADRSEKSFVIGTQSDAAVNRKLLEFKRTTGQTVNQIVFGNTTDNPRYSFVGSQGVECTYVEIAKSTADAGMSWAALAAPVDAKWWNNYARGTGSWFLAATNDAFTVERSVFNFIRSGVAIASGQYGNPTDNYPHTFYGNIVQLPDTRGITTGYGIIKSAAFEPSLQFYATDGPLNEKKWQIVGLETGQFYIGTLSDDELTFSDLLNVDRTGVAITSVEWGNATDQPKHKFYGKSDHVFDGFTYFEVGVGDTPPKTDYTYAELFSSDYCEIIAQSYGNVIYGPGMGVAKGRGTKAAPLKVLAGDSLGQFYFAGRLPSLQNGFPCVMQYTASADATTQIVGYWSLRMGTVEADYKERVKVAWDGTIDLASVALPATVRTNGIEVGYRQIPRIASGAATATTAVNGKCYSATGTITVPASVFAAGDSFSIYNNTAANLSVVQGAGLTLRLVGSGTTGTRTLAQRSIVTVWFESPTEAVITGGGLT
jgi:hypothetical protein